MWGRRFSRGTCCERPVTVKVEQDNKFFFFFLSFLLLDICLIQNYQSIILMTSWYGQIKPRVVWRVSTNFYSKVYFEEENILWSFTVKIFNGCIHIIFRLRRVIRWIIRVHRQIIRLIIYSKHFPDSDWLKAHA